MKQAVVGSFFDTPNKAIEYKKHMEKTHQKVYGILQIDQFRHELSPRSGGYLVFRVPEFVEQESKQVVD